MSPSPYLYAGLTPKVPMYWVIPGYTGPGSDFPHINTIYKHVVRYFNKIPHSNFERRYRDYVMVRYWTILIAMCLGYSSSKVGLFFNKDHSTALHASKRIMGEIELYKDSSQVFKYFVDHYKISPRKTQSKTIKQFITTWKNKQNM